MSRTADRHSTEGEEGEEGGSAENGEGGDAHALQLSSSARCWHALVVLSTEVASDPQRPRPSWQ